MLIRVTPSSNLRIKKDPAISSISLLARRRWDQLIWHSTTRADRSGYRTKRAMMYRYFVLMVLFSRRLPILSSIIRGEWLPMGEMFVHMMEQASPFSLAML